MSLNCSYFPMFPNSPLVAPEPEKGAITIRNTCLLSFHPALCEKHETVKTASANVTSLFIAFPAPDDPASPANSNK